MIHPNETATMLRIELESLAKDFKIPGRSKLKIEDLRREVRHHLVERADAEAAVLLDAVLGPEIVAGTEEVLSLPVEETVAGPELLPSLDTPPLPPPAPRPSLKERDAARFSRIASPAVVFLGLSGRSGTNAKARRRVHRTGKAALFLAALAASETR